MNSCNWTFVGQRGYTSKIALRHGINSGNLIIFCGSKILLIDYDVFGDKDYSFFLEDEFVKIHVRKKKKGFIYEFKLQEEVDTPLNRKRNAYYRFRLIDTIKKAVLAFSIIFIIVLAGYTYKVFTRKQDLGEHSLVAQVLMRPVKDYLTHNARYSFLYKDFNYNRDKITLETLPDSTILAGNGMPLENYDEFYIVFSYAKPYNNRIEYDKPTFFQLSRYNDRLSEKIREQGPTSQAECDCIFKAVLDEIGVNGLANVYYQTVSPTENPYNNKDTYAEMMENPKLKERVGNCSTVGFSRQ